MLELAQSLLADNAEHVAACCQIEVAKAMRRPRVEILYLRRLPRTTSRRVRSSSGLPRSFAWSRRSSSSRWAIPMLRPTLRFLGSPTMRVDSRDVEPGAEERREFVVSCRVYPSERGVAGQPDEGWIREALSGAAK